MNFRNLSAWSIRNPVIPLVLFVALLLAGLVSFKQMEVTNNPDVDFPAVQVTISQPGAAPIEIENQITQRVESALASINGVNSLQSSAGEGYSSTFVEFQIGTEITIALSEVQTAIDGVRPTLPDGILEPQVQKVNISGEPIGYIAVEADDMTIEELSWFVDDTVSKRLLKIEGMAEVGRFGGVDREIEVLLEPAKMQALGVTAAQINGVLRQDNLNASGGLTEVGGTRQSLRVLGNSQSAYDLSQRQIQLGGSRSVRLADVATVRDGYAERSSISEVGDKEVVNFYMNRARGASDLAVYEKALEEIDKIEAETEGVRFVRMGTSTDYTRIQYTSSMSALFEGAVLAVIVVFLFLRDWRATAISAVAIPLSAIPTFFFMDLMGFNLNFLSLLALGLVAGVLVDDAIVEIENIVRHMRMGKTAYQASIDAADEIGLPVVATSFCIVAVFLPVGLMPGISGEFFKNFAFTVVVAVLMSLAVARMVTPLMAAYFLNSHGHASHGEGAMMDRYMRILNWTLDTSGLDARRDGLEPPRARGLYSAMLGLTTFALLFVSSAVLFELLNGAVSNGVAAGAGPWSGLVGLAIPDAAASAVTSDPNSTVYFLVSKLFDIVVVLTALIGSFLASWLAFKFLRGLSLTVRSTAAWGAITKRVLALGFILMAALLGAGLASLLVAIILPNESAFTALEALGEGEAVEWAFTSLVYLFALLAMALFAGFGAATLAYRGARRIAAGPDAIDYLAARFYDHRVWMLGVGWFSLLLTAVLIGQVPAQFEPETDRNSSTVDIQLVPGATLATTKEVVDDVTTLLEQQQEFDFALERIRIGSAKIFVTLKEDRERTSIEFERQLAPELAKVPDARVRFESQGGGFGSGRDISLMLAGSDPDLLAQTATSLIEDMKGLDSIIAPRVSGDVNRPELLITPRREIAAELGVSTAALSRTIRIATLGEIEQNAARFSLSDRQIPIKVKLSESDRTDLSTIENLPVQTINGGTVPLSRVADITFGAGPTVIQRYNQSRRVIIGADLADGVLKGAAQAEIDELPTLQNLPTGVIRDVVGDEQWQIELQNSLGIAIIAGFFLVFACLVLLYKRLISPLVNMTSLLLAPLGGILFIWLLGEPQSMPVYIGILLLLGIVSKNSILLIDFAIEEMERGTEKLEALLEAGHKRAQPIIMTTVAMTAGMVPTALSLTGDEAWRKPMGIVVIGGLILSTLLTLLIVPAGFSLADGFERRVGPWLRKRLLTYKPGDDARPALTTGTGSSSAPPLPPGNEPAE